MSIISKFKYNFFLNVIQLCFPFLNIYIIKINYGLERLLEIEIALSLLFFMSTFVSWGTNTLISRLGKSLMSGHYITLLILKTILSIPALSIMIMVFYFGKGDLAPNYLVFVILLLLSSIIDPTWLYLSFRRYWITPLISVTRLILISLTTSMSMDLYYVFGFSYFTPIFVAVLYERKNFVKYRFSNRFFFYLIKRFYYPTAVEMLSAVVTRLDFNIASQLLNVDQLFAYLIIRRLINAGNMILNNLVPIFFVEAKRDDIFRIFQQILFLAVFGSILFITVNVGLTRFDEVFSSATDFVIFMIGSLFFPIGTIKNYIRFKFVLGSKNYKNDFKVSFFSTLAFCAGIATVLFFPDETIRFYLFLTIKLITDIIYIGYYKKYG